MDLPDSGRRSLSLLGHDGLTAYRAQGSKLPTEQITNRYTVKKEKKIFLIFSKRRFRRDPVQSHIRLTAS